MAVELTESRSGAEVIELRPPVSRAEAIERIMRWLVVNRIGTTREIAAGTDLTRRRAWEACHQLVADGMAERIGNEVRARLLPVAECDVDELSELEMRRYGAQLARAWQKGRECGWW